MTPDFCTYRDLDVDFTQDTLRMTDPPLVAVEIASPTHGTVTAPLTDITVDLADVFSTV